MLFVALLHLDLCVACVLNFAFCACMNMVCNNFYALSLVCGIRTWYCIM
jgi:hypothetical protein